MKIALALCLILFAIGVMTNPFGKEDRADTEELTRAEKERLKGKFDNFGAEKRGDEEKELTRAEKELLRGKFDNFGEEKRGDEEKEYKREDPEVEFKRAGTQCDPNVGLWPGGKVYYAFCQAEIKTQKVDTALAKLKEIFEGYLQLIEITPGSSCGASDYGHYIAFQNTESGCWSVIGESSGVNQPLNLQTGKCESVGVIMHEILHAIGLYHTQQRPDASQFIKTITANIKPGKEGNFDPKPTICTNCKYQTCSIMHYRSSAFSTGGKTIEPKVGSMLPQMGQQTDVEAGDICAVYSLYAELTAQKQCGGNGDSCKFGTGREYYNFQCCRCPPNLKGELCDQFQQVTSNDKEYELSSDGTAMTIKSQTKDKYDPSSTTTYFVRADENCKIKMTVVDFSVEADSVCYWDQFLLWNTTSIHDCPGTLCGVLPAGTSYSSEKNFMMMKIISDEMYQEKGFTLEFRAVECS